MRWTWIAALAIGLALPKSMALASDGPDLFAHMSEQQKDALAARIGAGVPRKPRVLVLGAQRGFHHESASDAMAAIALLGQESGAFDTELRTDFDLISAKGGDKMRFGFIPQGLGDFDALVLVNTTGEWGLSAEAKRALLDFVHEKGKAIIGIHGALDANYSWPDYAAMMGGEFGGHPLNSIDMPILNFPLVNEDEKSPITRHWPTYFSQLNELYVPRGFSRQNTHVLLRINPQKIDTTPAGLSDIPVAWTRNYGAGRVFYSSIGHTRNSWRDPDVRKMYLEAIRWGLRLTSGDQEN